MVRVGRVALKKRNCGVILPARQIRSVAKFQPRKIQGRWRDGYALDLHTLSSTPIGYNEYGHMQFDTNAPRSANSCTDSSTALTKRLSLKSSMRSANLRPPGILAQK